MAYSASMFWDKTGRWVVWPRHVNGHRFVQLPDSVPRAARSMRLVSLLAGGILADTSASAQCSTLAAPSSSSRPWPAPQRRQPHHGMTLTPLGQGYEVAIGETVHLRLDARHDWGAPAGGGAWAGALGAAG